MATIENFEMSELDLQNQENQNNADNNEENDEEMLNIGEFVYNHITAETDGTFLHEVRRRVAIHSKKLIKF
jgi:hypothetical protein